MLYIVFHGPRKLTRIGTNIDEEPSTNTTKDPVQEEATPVESELIHGATEIENGWL